MIEIKKWFMDKNFSQNEKYVITTSRNADIERETEKAILVSFSGKYGTFKTWLPKSVVTIAEAAAITVGQTVKHSKFGTGTIEAVDENICTVRFGDSVKMIAAEYLAVA